MEKIIIRKVNIEDAKSMMEFIKKVSNETDFLLSSYDEINMTLENEIEYLQNITKSKNNIIFVLDIDGEIAGSCGLTSINKKRIKHRATLGISVLKKYWGEGLGNKLIDNAIKYAKKANIKKLELEVRVDNEKAIKLYKKFGFEIEGEIRNYFYLNKKYYNCYFMGLLI